MTALTRTDDTTDVRVVSRERFLAEWHEDYQRGQHVTFLGPTQRGKTTLTLQLLGESISPEHQCVILASKPPGRDGTIAKAPKMLNLREVSEWPPGYRFGDRKRNGYLLRPAHDMTNHDATKANLAHHFKAAMDDNYATRNDRPRITVADEAHIIQNRLKLKDEYEAPLMSGAPDNAMWSLIQRGRYMSYHAYGAPEHLFIFFDPDQSNRQRYSEIGGVDPKLVMRIAETLKTYRVATGGTISECLYIRRSGPELMIVDVQ